MTIPDPIIVHTVRDFHTLACPLCDITVNVPEVPVSDSLGAVFGMSGDTFARVQADRSVQQVSRQMRDHLKGHPVEDWLPLLTSAIDDVARCEMCKRPRTPLDKTSYDPVQVLTGQPIGWYSGEDGEVCGNCMTNTIRSGT